MRQAIKITFDNGNAQTVTTEINGTPDEIRAYYLGHWFALCDDDDMHKATAVDFIHPCGHACEHEPAIGQRICPCSSGECA